MIYDYVADQLAYARRLTEVAKATEPKPYYWLAPDWTPKGYDDLPKLFDRMFRGVRLDDLSGPSKTWVFDPEPRDDYVEEGGDGTDPTLPEEAPLPDDAERDEEDDDGAA